MRSAGVRASVGKADAGEEGLEGGVGTEGVEAPVYFDEGEAAVALVECLLQVRERLFALATDRDRGMR